MEIKMFFFSLLISVLLISVRAAKEDSMILITEDFSEQIKTPSIFVLFVENIDQLQEKFDDVNKFWYQLADFYNSKKDSKIKIAIVDCRSNNKLCSDQKITDPLVAKHFGEEPESSASKKMLSFFKSTIQKQLDKLSIEEKLKTEKCLVYFFTPNCPHCKKLAPIWSDLEKSYATSNDLTLLSVNCEQQTKICRAYNPGIKYPSIYWIVQGKSVEKFVGDKTFAGLQDFVKRMMATRAKRSIPEEAKRSESGVYELTSETYYDFIKSNCSFIKFFMPNCGACQKVNKAWDPLAESVADYPKIKIARVNCSENSALCSNEANGCPTLTIFCNNKKILKDFQRDFSVQGLKDCIVSNCEGGEKKHDWYVRQKIKQQLERDAKNKKKEEAQKH